MKVYKYTFKFRISGRNVIVTIEASSLEEAMFIISNIKELQVSYQNKKENGEENKS
jgi:hypothetical protein